MNSQLKGMLLCLAVAVGSATNASAQDKNVKIGVLTDMARLYADITGAGSVVAAKMAVEYSGLTNKGWKIDVISADHQNKQDVGANIARPLHRDQRSRQAHRHY